MNKLTRQIKNKGYTLTEFCEHIGYSLRWYRTHEKPDSSKHDVLLSKVNELESKNDNR